MRLNRAAEVSAGFCREAATDYSPGLQPWVLQAETRALKVAPNVRAIRSINRPFSEHTLRSPLVRHIVLVLVVVLVLERFVVSYLRLELFLRAPFELHPAPAGLEMLSGRFNASPHPGLKPWAILYNRFAVKSDNTWAVLSEHFTVTNCLGSTSISNHCNP